MKSQDCMLHQLNLKKAHSLRWWRHHVPHAKALKYNRADGALHIQDPEANAD